MWNWPDFLQLPEREVKPRRCGLTHVLDKGTPTHALDALLAQAGHLVDVLKVGWGIAFIDPTIKERVAVCNAAGVTVCLGGTLLEVCAAQGKVAELCGWAAEVGVDAIEVSNGLQAMTSDGKRELIRRLCGDFTVLAETGAKDDNAPVLIEEWLDELEADLEAGASWVIAEGRESGTVGVYRPDGSVRAELVEAIADRVPVDRVIFEAPRKAQQAWFVRRFGTCVNLGNIAPEEVLPLETLRVGLRADTALGGVGAGIRAPTGAGTGAESGTGDRTRADAETGAGNQW